MLRLITKVCCLSVAIKIIENVALKVLLLSDDHTGWCVARPPGVSFVKKSIASQIMESWAIKLCIAVCRMGWDGCVAAVGVF